MLILKRSKGDLGKKDLIPEDWGGNIQMIPVSVNGDGIDNLLESTLIWKQKCLNLKHFMRRITQGIVIESELDKFKGAVATLLVQNGSLK